LSTFLEVFLCYIDVWFLTAARTSNNIYVLSEIGNEKCCLEKEDESWLWHRIMGHMNFDNLVKVSKREAVREMP
jgi:hypothetical protein